MFRVSTVLSSPVRLISRPHSSSAVNLTLGHTRSPTLSRSLTLTRISGLRCFSAHAPKPKKGETFEQRTALPRDLFPQQSEDSMPAVLYGFVANWLSRNFKWGEAWIFIVVGSLVLYFAVAAFTGFRLFSPDRRPENRLIKRAVYHSVDMDFSLPAYKADLKRQINAQLDAGITPSIDTLAMENIDVLVQLPELERTPSSNIPSDE